MNFEEFYQTKEVMPIGSGADHLGVDVELFEDDDEIIVFDEYSFMSRRGDTYNTIIYNSEHSSNDEIEIAKHVYFDHWVFDRVENTKGFVVQFYKEWLQWQKLTQECALELSARDDLNDYQRNWLMSFNRYWDNVIENERV